MEYDTKCKNCELAAWTYCRSENANLCWDCDTIAHQDNPSVSVHLRQLLCHKCQSRTIWYGSGPKLPISMACCYFCDPKTSGNVDFITQRVKQIYMTNMDVVKKSKQDLNDLFKDQDPLLHLDHSKVSPADAKRLSGSIILKDNADHDMPSRTIIIEHSNEDPIFKISAEEITTGLYLHVDHNFTVEINPMSEDLEHPYDELRNLDKKALINKIRGS